MEINVFNERKTVEVWISRAERDDAALRTDLQALFPWYQKQGYFVAVFFSGAQDLAKTTGALLCYNRKHLAEVETERTKAAKINTFPHLPLANMAE